METIYTAIAESFELLGTLTMVIGFIIAATLSVRTLLRHEGGTQAFSTLRITLGSAILLGLEILVAADLVRTITSKPSIEEAIILGLIVLIRTILSWSIQIEIEGVLPWKRALVESGGSLLAKQVKEDHAKQVAFSRGNRGRSGGKSRSANADPAEATAQTPVDYPSDLDSLDA